jgi:hypothetical protein
MLYGRFLPVKQMFKDLTKAQQTVLFSRTSHQEPDMPKVAISQNFYEAALRNDWRSAENHLRNYKLV